MFAVGDRVIVKDNKADSTRLKIGMTGTLYMINEHFIVVKIDELSDLQLMFAPAEFFATFKKCEEKKERVWTKWETTNTCEFIDARDLTVDYTYTEARHNGKRVQVKDTYTQIIAEASCHDEDPFDFNTGIDIALARLSMKLTEHTLQEKIRNME